MAKKDVTGEVTHFQLNWIIKTAVFLLFLALCKSPRRARLRKPVYPITAFYDIQVYISHVGDTPSPKNQRNYHGNI